jgi:hypothetical protein
LTGLDDALNQLNVNLVKTLSTPPAFIQDTGHANHCVRPGKLFGQYIGVINIGLDERNAGQHIHATTADPGTGQDNTLMLIGGQRSQKMSAEISAGAYQYNSHITSS